MNIASIVRKCVKWPLAATLWLTLLLSAPVLARDSTIPTLEEEKQIATDCASLLDQANSRRVLQIVRAQLHAQGMRLVTQGCPFVRTSAGNMQQVLDVRVQVLDSDVAAGFVRGPLADGDEVDMGAVHLLMPEHAPAVAQAQEEDASPDVLFNRQWLAGVMQARGLQAVPDHWWAFVPSVAATR